MRKKLTYLRVRAYAAHRSLANGSSSLSCPVEADRGSKRTTTTWKIRRSWRDNWAVCGLIQHSNVCPWMTFRVRHDAESGREGS